MSNSFGSAVGSYLESWGVNPTDIQDSITSTVTKVRNVVMNYTEMEAKVREATNDEPWGVSSSKMQEIAQGTFNFQHFNEIMSTIYKRFTEKEARQWRQIYKALQLLEYLVKNGSERVVDDARSHLSLIRILRNFHYIDEKGKDQGINVRNRSKELAELLGDVERIRTERRKAKATRNKYVGVGNDSFMSGGGGGGGGGSRYGGFGSDTFASGGDSGYSGGGSSSFRDTANSGDLDDYDAGEWDDRGGASSTSASAVSAPRRSATSSSATSPPPAPKVEPPKKEVNLFDFDDDEPAPVATPSAIASAIPPPAAASTGGLDDDFDDFQSAPSGAPAPVAAPPSAPAAKPTTFFDMIGNNTSSPAVASPTSSFSSPPLAASRPVAPMQPQQPQQPQRAPADFFGASGSSSAGATSPSSAYGGMSSMASLSPSSSSLSGSFASMNISGAAQQQRPAAVAAPGGSPFGQQPLTPNANASKPSANFDDLWNLAGGPSTSSANNATTASAAAPGKVSMASLAQQKTQASLWGPAQGGGAGAGAGSSGGDLLL